ncbi:hypothetical protein ACMHYJ_05245 [Castellaniella hirudinis]|uniref:hypothetical protein n=1 Tax=Castellaniella hirudinis TaxID=1144617 RepID=UPI0039C2E32C
MKRSDLNHLRRLVAWVRGAIGQDPAEMQKTMIDIADKIGHMGISDEGKARLVESYRRAEAVPQYVRDAVKMLDRYVRSSGQGGGPEKPRADEETRVDTDVDGGPDHAGAPTPDGYALYLGCARMGLAGASGDLQSMIGWMRRRQGWPSVLIAGWMAGDIADMLERLQAPGQVADGASLSGWQPIETAPKDGTWILAWRGPATGGYWDPMVIVRWYEWEDDPGNGTWVWPDDRYDVWTPEGQQRADAMLGDGSLFEDNGFTHWMPLPQPPKEGVSHE